MILHARIESLVWKVLRTFEMAQHLLASHIFPTRSPPASRDALRSREYATSIFLCTYSSFHPVSQGFLSCPAATKSDVRLATVA